MRKPGKAPTLPYPILVYPDPHLRRVALPVRKFDEELRRTAMDMYLWMKTLGGCGLAAPQMDESIRLVVASVPKEDNSGEFEDFCLVNPVVIANFFECEMEEGCLSIPGYFHKVTRPKMIAVEYQDLQGKMHELKADGLLARVILHEIDHLDGKLFIDGLSKLKQDRAKKAAQTYARRFSFGPNLDFAGKRYAQMRGEDVPLFAQQHKEATND